MEKFRPLIEGKGVTYLHLDGDADHVLKYLVTDYRGSLDFVRGLLKLKKENPNFMEQTQEAVQNSDLVMYGTCSGFARSVADLYGIPCVRYFYSPMDKTSQYSLYSEEYDSKAVAKSYQGLEQGLNLITALAVNDWRKKMKLPKWKLSSDYLTKNGKRVLTFYPVSPLLMPRDSAWGEQIHVTGYWYHPEEDAEKYVMPKDLEKFMQSGEQPIFVGFGKAQSEELARLQVLTLEALEETGIRAIVQAEQLPAERKRNNDQLYFLDAVPYSFIFQKVKAVVHHGGCTTNGLGIWAGCPTLVIPLALDQYFYGRMIHRLGMGPEPLYIRKKLCTREQLKESLQELVSGRYEENARAYSVKIRQEHGIEEAMAAICQYADQ